MRIIPIGIVGMAHVTHKASSTPTTLGQLPIGGRAKITKILGSRFIAKRLLGLGLRVGSEVNVLHHRGHGVVVASDGNRIALGDSVADKLLINPIG